jgi:ATP-binding cassette subfamily F protein 3
MDSREALAGVLKEYKGTLILVSHDRWLLSQVTEQTLDIRKAGPIVYPGGYTEYRRKQSNPNADQRPKPKEVSPAPTIPKLLDGKQPVEEPAMTPRELSKEISRLEKLVKELEDKVTADEGSLKSLEEQLSNLSPTADVFSLTREHQAMQEQLEGSLSAWEETSSRLERLVAMRG